MQCIREAPTSKVVGSSREIREINESYEERITKMVSTVSIIFIVMNMLLGILIPVGLLLYFICKYKVSVRSVFFCCSVMLLFA